MRAQNSKGVVYTQIHLHMTTNYVRRYLRPKHAFVMAQKLQGVAHRQHALRGTKKFDTVVCGQTTHTLCNKFLKTLFIAKIHLPVGTNSERRCW